MPTCVSGWHTLKPLISNRSFLSLSWVDERHRGRPQLQAGTGWPVGVLRVGSANSMRRPLGASRRASQRRRWGVGGRWPAPASCVPSGTRPARPRTWAAKLHKARRRHDVQVGRTQDVPRSRELSRGDARDRKCPQQSARSLTAPAFADDSAAPRAHAGRTHEAPQDGGRVLPAAPARPRMRPPPTRLARAEVA